MRRLLAVSILLALGACAPAVGDDDDDATPEVCEYPEGAVEPMEADAVIFPYSWPEARHGDGREGPLALLGAWCADDDLTDWSAFDALLMVSLPAW